MKTKERLITVGDAFSVLRRFWALILAAVLAGGVLGYLYADMKKNVYYEASSRVIVQMATVDEYEGQEANDISRARAIAKSLENEITNDELIVNVRRYFADRQLDRPGENWEDLSVAAVSDTALRGMLSAHAEDSSQHLTITVKAPTPSLAVRIANAAAGELQASVIVNVGNCTVTPTTTATSAVERVEFSKRTVLLAAGLAAVGSYGLLFLYVFLDPRVQNSREIMGNYAERYPFLGTIPSDKQKKGGKTE